MARRRRWPRGCGRWRSSTTANQGPGRDIGAYCDRGLHDGGVRPCVGGRGHVGRRRAGHPHQPRRQPRADDPRRRPQGRPGRPLFRGHRQSGAASVGAGLHEEVSVREDVVLARRHRGDHRQDLGRDAREQSCRRSGRRHRRRRARHRGETHAALLTRPWSRRCRNATGMRADTGRAPGSAISASPTTPGWCRPIRCRRATTTCSTRAGAASLPGASGPRAARRCSSPPSGWRGARRRRREYFQKLAAQKVINFGSGSARTLVDRVIAGEFPIALNIFAHHPLISRAKGAPVNSQLMDPVASTAGTMIIPRGVRNPHAALLLADFILSQEGQQILADADYFPVRSDVPPKDVLASVIPAARRRAGAVHRLGSAQ